MNWAKDIVRWVEGNTLYLSVVFSWQLREAQLMAESWDGPVIAGGPAVKLNSIDWAEVRGECGRDVLSMHNSLATFTTRGCIRRCPFCAVPRLEGEFRELPDFRPAPIICDNNLTAASMAHFTRVIDVIKNLDGVDFNQGLDARIYTKEHANQIVRLKRKGLKVRFSLDHIKEADAVSEAIKITRQAGIGKEYISIYVLIGFKDTPQKAHEKLELVRSWGVLPFPMRYQPLDAKHKNCYVSPGWTDFELRRMVRYYSRLNYLEHIPYEDFHGHGKRDSETFTF